MLVFVLGNVWKVWLVCCMYESRGQSAGKNRPTGQAHLRKHYNIIIIIIIITMPIVQNY